MKNLHLWDKIIKEADGEMAYHSKDSIYSNFNDKKYWIVIVDQNGYLQMQFRLSEAAADMKANEDLIINNHYISEINENRFHEVQRMFNEFKDKCIQ